MTSAYIISACRSPVTPRGGALAQLSLPDLAVAAVHRVGNLQHRHRPRWQPGAQHRAGGGTA